MSIYRIIWWIAAAVLVLAGFIAAITVIETEVLMSVVIAAALIGGGQPWLSSSTLCAATPRRILPVAARGAAAATIVLVSVTGLIAVSGAGALPLVLMMTITSSPVHRWLRNNLAFMQTTSRCSPGTTRETSRTANVPPTSLPDCSELSNDALCQRWRASFTALQKVSSSSDQMAVARIRQQYLDEIERRDPEGFTRWFESGARAGSDPSKFLTTRDRRQPPADRS
ncbi:hypothetical protein [Rhodococcus globerulus]|uniref:hypothetical protein n=1 Tax=Rhodococcus globerulus TaxID=33008 RepID=UPI001F3EF949|nr:hypothetical protein [Rhodococcus globerulus]MCE4269248.1 hypothetical protein [Rhodococcus globerulus]